MTSKYLTLITTKGLTKIDKAIATGNKLVITHMAVGDGGGSEVTPTEGQTALVNEVYRTEINAKPEIDYENHTIKVVATIRENFGGWWIREVGLFDADGDLLVVASQAATYKPTLDEGTGKTITIELVVQHGNVESIEVVFDPSLAFVTREEGDRFGINGLPEYGASVDDEYLDSLNIPGIYHVSVYGSKKGIDSGDYIITVFKAKKPDGKYLISQTAKTWSIIGGGHPDLLFSPVFYRALIVNNENKPTSRKYWSRFEIAKIGQISFFAHTHAQPGYFYCDGSAVDRKTYYMLYDIIGVTFGAGDGSTTFNIPDLRDRFIRGHNLTKKREFGTYQGDVIAHHTHTVAIRGNSSKGGRIIIAASAVISGDTCDMIATDDPKIIDETNPKNINLYPCICYL